MPDNNAITIQSRQGPLQHLDADRNGVNAYGIYNSDFIVSGGDDKRIRIWNWNTGEEEKVLWAESHHSITCLRVSHNHKLLASGHGSWGGIHVWSLESGELLWSLDDIMYVDDVAFSQDDKQIIMIDSPCHIMTFNAKNGDIINEHGDRDVSGISILSSDGRYAFAIENEVVRSVNCTDGKERWSVPIHGKYTMAISHDDSMLAVLDEDSTIWILRCGDGAIGPSITPDPEKLSQYGNHVLAFTPDDKRIAMAFSEKYLQIWNIADNRLVAQSTIINEPALGFSSLKFLDDGQRFILGNRYGINTLGEFHLADQAPETNIQWKTTEVSEFDKFVREYGLQKSSGYWTSETFEKHMEKTDVDALMPYTDLLIDLNSERGGTTIDLLDKLLNKIQKEDENNPVIMDITIEMLRLGSRSVGAAIHDSWGMLISFTEKAADLIAKTDLSTLTTAQIEKLIKSYKQASNFSVDLGNIDVNIRNLGTTLTRYLKENSMTDAYNDILPYYKNYENEISNRLHKK